MARRACDGDALLEAFRAAVVNLEAHVAEVNSLNVYPVPDGDTGSNMMATVAAALGEAERSAGQPADRVAAALSFGALMGARGNSGVITSQILRGVAEGLEGKRRFNALDFAHALSEGARTAYGAVTRPVEGTILTVVREAAAAAVAAAERDGDLEAVLAATTTAAEESVALTPSLLPILHEAGVVDSGGQGLYRLFQGALRHVRGGPAATFSPATSAPRAVATHVAPDRTRAATLVAHADEGWGYETMFLVRPAGTSLLDVDAIRARLETLGDSVLVAGDPRAVKVHVHSERPDEVIAYGLSLGSLSRISIENLDDQAREVREERAASFAGEDAGAAPTADAGSTPTADAGTTPTAIAGIEPTPAAPAAPAAPVPAAEPLPLAVVAVAAGDGLEAIFLDFGAAGVVRGGQTANPSTGELVEAIRSCDAREILLLPNNPNVVLAARQAASLADRPVGVVPTRNAAEGFAALLALDPTRGALDNVEAMTEASREVQTFSVTRAVRDATIGGRRVRHGQTIALDPDDGLVAVHDDALTAMVEAIGTLRPGFELVSLFYGEDVDLAEAEATARRIHEELPGIEIEVRHGGQPYYRFLVAAE